MCSKPSGPRTWDLERGLRHSGSTGTGTGTPAPGAGRALPPGPGPPTGTGKHWHCGTHTVTTGSMVRPGRVREPVVLCHLQHTNQWIGKPKDDSPVGERKVAPASSTL